MEANCREMYSWLSQEVQHINSVIAPSMMIIGSRIDRNLICADD